jgi:hypothetical protein
MMNDENLDNIRDLDVRTKVRQVLDGYVLKVGVTMGEATSRRFSMTAALLDLIVTGYLAIQERLDRLEEAVHVK